MKLTQKQLEIVNNIKRLEKKYGQGNVFIQYINDFWRLLLIIHRKGESTYHPLLKEKVVDRRVMNALEKKGLATGCDNMHNEGIDPNSWRSQPGWWHYVGVRVKTECI